MIGESRFNDAKLLGTLNRGRAHNPGRSWSDFRSKMVVPKVCWVAGIAGTRAQPYGPANTNGCRLPSWPNPGPRGPTQE